MLNDYNGYYDFMVNAMLEENALVPEHSEMDKFPAPVYVIVSSL